MPENKAKVKEIYMKLTKTLYGVTAALTVLSSMAVTAQAEETQLKLLTAPIDSNSLSNYGGDYYWDGTNVLKISEDELVEWRKSGTLSIEKVDNSGAISGLTNMSGSFDSGYMQFASTDSNNNVTERFLVSVDKANGKLSTVCSLGSDWSYTNNDGYTFGCKEIENAIEIYVYDTEGVKKTSSLPINGRLWSSYTSHGGEIVGYVMVQTGENEDHNPAYELYAVNKDASTKLIAKNALEGGMTGFGIIGAAENCVVFAEWNARLQSSQFKLYSTEDGKAYDINCFKSDDEEYFRILDSSSGKTYGSNIIIGVDGNPKMYVLMNYKENKPVSKLYTVMGTNDGKIYTVQTADGKRGFIDANGKELAMFDFADSFFGDYAPVVKDGKAYLIDRNMNKVSDEFDADIFVTFTKDLFAFAKGDDITVVTYTEAEKQSTTSDTTSKPVTSEMTTSSDSTNSTASETISSTISNTTSSTGNTNENNPATGFTMAMLPVALIGGAAVIVAKKRRK